MASIVLTTINARYAHASFGLRYLRANLGTLRDSSAIVEFESTQRPMDMAEKILAHDPKIVGVGVYIWNADLSLQLVALLKRLRPKLTVVLGGPEISHETNEQEITRWADYAVTGEGDRAFAELCRKLLDGDRPLTKIIPADLPTFEELDLPYDEYTDDDIAHRVIYVEASRGCPFSCEFCLSSLDVPVRNVQAERFLNAMRKLLDRGVRRFKFVDRTFNLNLAFSAAILRFFLEHPLLPGLFLHFEMIPDRLPAPLRELIERFPAGVLQFEVGIQTFSPEVSERISRRQDNAKLEENLRWLREHTGVHVHADLIVGLPGEDVAGFAAGFDRLVALGPQEIQVGILKRLRGTPIVRHDREWGMLYSPHAPYEVLSTSVIDFATMQRMRRFSRYWDLTANSGNFVVTAPLLWSSDAGQDEQSGPAPFAAFLRWSDWLFERSGRTHGIALPRLAEWLFAYLTTRAGVDRRTAAAAMWADQLRAGRTDLPEYLRGLVDPPAATSSATSSRPGRRQARHLGVS